MPYFTLANERRLARRHLKVASFISPAPGAGTSNPLVRQPGDLGRAVAWEQ